MKTKLTLAVAIAVFSTLIYPFMERYARFERGYDGVFGGEEVLLFMGWIVAILILVTPKKVKSETNEEDNNYV